VFVICARGDSMQRSTMTLSSHTLSTYPDPGFPHLCTATAPISSIIFMSLRTPLSMTAFSSGMLEISAGQTLMQVIFR
jgi:hypothetical protein